jgi:ABC-type amino acid transport substrate-binding protein
LRFAFYGRVSTEDHQDRVTSRVRQRDQAGALVAGHAGRPVRLVVGDQGSVMAAEFPSTGEHYGLLLAKGDPLVTCVNKALTTLKKNGTLATLQKKYLQIHLRVPTIQP